MGYRTRLGAAALAALLIGVGAAPAPPVRADEAATERRLKRLEVSAELRGEIHGAIDRGVAWLASNQGPDGRWLSPDSCRYWSSRIPFGDVHNALAALALVHADTPAAREAADRALAALLPADRPPAPSLVTTVPGACYAEMLLDATGADPRLIGQLAARIAAGRDPGSGAFAYLTGAPPAPGLPSPPRIPPLAGPVNLFVSGLGVLGLHVAERHGARGTAEAWEDVLEGLLRSQLPDGSWSIAFHHPGAVSSPSATATPAGLSSLTLAARHLRVAEDTGRGTSRRRRVEAAMAKARVALEADGTLILWRARRASAADREGALGGWNAFAGFGSDAYPLWTLERTCVFLGIERVDGTPWYAHAARSLVDGQRPDGSWGGPAGGDAGRLLETSFALLVLLRDAERIATGTPATEAAGETTPPPDDAAAKDGRPPAGVPVDEAAAALDRLREAVRSGAAPNGELSDLLALLARARRDLAPPRDAAAPAVDPTDLLAGIRAAFVDALFIAGEDPGGDEEGRRPVNRAAADLLADAPEEVLALVRARLERGFAAGKATDGPLETTPWRPAFRLLARRGDAATFAWMLDAARSDDLTGERAERALAFLLAVPEFPPLPGPVRRKACDELANTYAGRSAASEAASALHPEAKPFDRMRWSRFRPRVMEALYALATDPGTGAPPRDARGRLPATVRAFADWLRDHRNPRAAPWR